MSPLSIFGGFVFTGAVVMLVRLRGHPMVLDNRWLTIPNLTLFLFFLLWPFAKTMVKDLEMPKEIAQLLTMGVCFGVSWLLARLFPLRWGGLYLLGIGESRMRTMLRDILKECDPGTRLRKRQWSVPAYETMVSLKTGFGKTSLVLHFRGNYAEDLIQVFLPTLRMDFAELKVSGGYPRLRLTVMLILGIPVGIAILAVLAGMIAGFLA